MLTLQTYAIQIFHFEGTDAHDDWVSKRSLSLSGIMPPLAHQYSASGLVQYYDDFVVSTLVDPSGQSVIEIDQWSIDDGFSFIKLQTDSTHTVMSYRFDTLLSKDGPVVCWAGAYTCNGEVLGTATCVVSRITDEVLCRPMLPAHDR